MVTKSRDRLDRHPAPDTVYLPRMVWLLVAPLGASFFPWLVVASNVTLDIGSWGTCLLASVPLLGALAALVYGLVASEPVRWWPLAPYALSAAAFLYFLVSVLNITDGDGLEFFPVLVIGLFQPFLALAGGVISFVWISPYRRC